MAKQNDVEVYKSVIGVSSAWRRLGTFVEHNGESYVVLLASPEPVEHCAGCALKEVTAADCLRLRRRSFGECLSMFRGDANAVIFHKVGTPIKHREVRDVNIRAGLEKFF